jgi:hypothetical protein
MGDGSFANPHELMTVPVSTMRASSCISSRRIKPQIVEIRPSLERLSAGGEFPPPSIRQVAKRLGCGDDALRRHFPELCSSIRIRHLEYVQAKKRQRRQEIYQQIRNIVSGLSNQGSYPSAKRVQGFLKATTDFRDRELRETWQRAKKEFGINRGPEKEPNAGASRPAS